MSLVVHTKDLTTFTPYDGLKYANQKSQMLGVFGLKLGGSHSLLYCYFDRFSLLLPFHFTIIVLVC